MSSEELEALRRRYLVSLSPKGDEIAAAIVALDQASSADKALGDIQRAAHKIAGSAGFYSQHDIMNEALALEVLIIEGLGGDDRQALVKKAQHCAAAFVRSLKARSNTVDSP